MVDAEPVSDDPPDTMPPTHPALVAGLERVLEQVRNLNRTDLPPGVREAYMPAFDLLDEIGVELRRLIPPAGLARRAAA